ncbi:MAG: FmdB family zinc ribbon protein, partial [Verrucomicrobiota bacterium]
VPYPVSRIPYPVSRIPHPVSRTPSFRSQVSALIPQIPPTMPTYLYQEILPDGSEGETFEAVQSMSEPSLKTHPKTGNPVRKVYSAPNLPTRYTEAATKSKLSNENVEKHGFTRYEKDKVTGRYHKTAGKDRRAPETVDATRLKKMQRDGLI